MGKKHIRKTLRYYVERAGWKEIFKGIKADLTNTPTLITLTDPELKYPIKLRVPSSDIKTHRQAIKDQEYLFDVETTPKVIIDAGANIGLASVYFANKYPDAEILAIEPEESNYQMLKLNAEPYENITVLKAALWNRNTEIDLVDPGSGNWGFMTTEGDMPTHKKSEFVHKVPAYTVDRLMQDFNFYQIDILKIDIEGAEKEVFHDPSAWINKVNSIIVELHERMKPGCNRSVYNATNDFKIEWSQGENIYLSKPGYLKQAHSR